MGRIARPRDGGADRHFNTASAAIVAFAAVLGGGAATRRGTLALWSLVVLLFVLVLFEIAHV